MAGDHFLAIADIVFALRCNDDRVQWSWDPPTQRFLIPPREADVHLTVDLLDEATRDARGELVFDSNGVWSLFRQDSRYRIECRYDQLPVELSTVALFDESFTRGTIMMEPEDLPYRVNPFGYPLDEVLMAHLLGRGRGVELHSCGVIDREGRGHLFAGVSGAGKTTTAHLWEPFASKIVSDDRVIIREQDGAFRMYGTPWHGEGELSAPASAPLAGVYLLEQSPSNATRVLEPAEAMARLFRCAFPPFHDAAAVDFTLSFLERLVSRVPVRELRFMRDASVVELVLAEAA